MAAGLGFKDFVTGEVLTAADVDGYLMQGIWVFASAAARDAAVTSPQEGNFAFLKDTNTTTYYTGSAWTNLDTTGMVNPMTTTGDTIYSSSGSTPARLGIGSTGQVLTVSGGVPTWATPASGLTYVGASVGFAADKTIANTTTTTLTFDNEVLDSNGFHDNSTNNSRLTIPSGKAGKYRISCQLFPIENNTGRREIRFVKNGTVLYGWNMNAYGYMERIDFYSYVDAIVGDYFEVTFRQNTGGNLTLYGTDTVGTPGFFNIDYLGV